MTGKTVLITGANKGIGFETARHMGRSGYRIWLGSRDVARGEAAAAKLSGIDVRVLPVDVTRDESVQAAAARIKTEDGKLDVLINNAGILGKDPSAPSAQSVDDIRSIYETNVFGAVRVTQAFLPLLKAAGRANIVMVSSGLGSLGWLADPNNQYYRINVLGYNSSKSALNAVTLSLAKELQAAGIKVNAVDPGYTATEFNGYRGPRTVEQAADGIAWAASLDAGGPTGGFFFDRVAVPW